MMLRDRDAVLTKNGMIFRIYGYSHPPKAYICDPEYAPANIYTSRNPRALRTQGGQVYYKFFTDEGLQLVQRQYPQYMIWHKPLHRKLVGVREEQIVETRKPTQTLKFLIEESPSDSLLKALGKVLRILERKLGFSTSHFGVFGSLLQGFYHPDFSDIDLIIYGKDELAELKEALVSLYQEDDSPLRNEFDSPESTAEKQWKFQNYSLDEYTWHQKRKLIYAVFKDTDNRRTIKTEFEPVKKWGEIKNEYSSKMKVEQLGWTRMLANVTDDRDAPFMPSTYNIEPVKVLKGPVNDNIRRVVSYVEEFRMQAQKDDLIYVEGNLEKVSCASRSYHQITLTYGPKYYEQTLKVVRSGFSH